MNTPNSEPRLNVAASPHWRDGSSLTRTQALWLLALAPAAVASVMQFGLMSLRVIALAVGSSVVMDALCSRVLVSKDHPTNWSSVSLGLLLAFMLPIDASWWLVLVGAFLTIVIGKKLFGGWGGYPVHPVALSYAMLAVSWPARLDFTASLASAAWNVTMVEPMRLIKTLGTSAEAAFDKTDLLTGLQVGGVGNAMVLWLLIGGLFLVLIRQTPWQIPLGFVVGVVACAWLLEAAAPGRTATPVFQLLAGSTALTAFFLIPEHTTSPVNPWPMLIYGLMGGVLMVLIRAFSSHIDGAIFAVLLVNLCSPLLDRLTPRVVGLEVRKNA